MKHDTKEVLNAMIDSHQLMIKAMEAMNDKIDKLTSRILELEAQIASLPRTGTIEGDKWPPSLPYPYSPQYPRPHYWPNSPTIWC